jgi:hypothetical protein
MRSIEFQISKRILEDFWYFWCVADYIDEEGRQGREEGELQEISKKHWKNV